ncbi:hypothetical protein EWM64_g7545 [Hericium alpestre]|uniref:Uncharacterized protein n=1 Tax=Hericium alpestre TaxID=135208 RepID=A0A4Y9ZQY1_9AGAM|nr:hypothetical protein EWM64_g7545 [Hericium alpestre]
MARVMVSVILTEVCMPCPKLRMLSVTGADFWYQTDARQAPPDFHFTDLCKAFPNVQFIRCDKAVISLDAPTLFGSATSEPQTLSELIGVQGDIESITLLGPLHKHRMVHIPHYQINTLPSLTRLTTALAGNSLCSLSLCVELQEPNWQDATRGLDAEQFFAEICRIAPRLRFLRLEMGIAIKPIGHRTHSSHLAVRQCEAMADISMVASSHLVGLHNLRCFCISFAPHIDKWAKELWEDFAALCIFDLPRIRFFVLDLIEDQICLECSEAATMHEDGVADIAEIDLDKEGVERLLERYQFEGSSWRLDGVADWLRSIQRLSR